MSFIQKHPILSGLGTLYLIIIIVLSLFPSLFITTSSSLESYETPDDLAYRITSRETGVTYELANLKTDNSVTYPKQIIPFLPMNYGMSSSIHRPDPEMNLFYESYLYRGTTLDLNVAVTGMTRGFYRIFIINEDGVIESFETQTADTDDISFKTKKSGNYAIIVYVEDANGSYQLDLRVKKSIFSF